MPKKKLQNKGIMKSNSGFKIYHWFYLIIVTMVLTFSCKKEVMDLNKFSTALELNQQGAIPLVKGKIALDDLLELTGDSEFLIIDGDTIKISYKIDSLIDYGFSNFTTIPLQASLDYVISPNGFDIPLYLLGYPIGTEVTLDSLGLNEPFTFDLDSMRLDKIVLNQGKIDIDIDNQFDMDIKLAITSSSIFDDKGNPLNELIYIDALDTAKSEIILEDYEIRFKEDSVGDIGININFVPTFIINNENAIIRAEDSLIIDFGFNDLNDFKGLYGYFGNYKVDSNTSYTFGDIENLKKLTGKFSVTDPMLNINYSHGFGVPIGIDLQLESYHNGVTDVIDMSPQVIAPAEFGENPLSEGSISFNKSTVTNIEKLFSFPLPDSISLAGLVESNPNGNDATDTNFVLGNSRLRVGLEIEIPMQFSADLTYRDTIKTKDLINLEEMDISAINYVYLHYGLTNGFPFGIGIDFVLLDTINDVVHPDTIKIYDDNTGFLLKPAPVDANGNVDKNNLEEVVGVIALENAPAQFFIEEATHVIINAKFQTTNASAVNIYYSSQMEFTLGAEYSLTYTTLNE